VVPFVYSIPAAHVEGDIETALYDSNRDYIEQLQHYKTFQGKKINENTNHQ
jgi:hypothetical protein